MPDLILTTLADVHKERLFLDSQKRPTTECRSASKNLLSLPDQAVNAESFSLSLAHFLLNDHAGKRPLRTEGFRRQERQRDRHPRMGEVENGFPQPSLYNSWMYRFLAFAYSLPVSLLVLSWTLLSVC